jgi:integrase/recombinase XerD
MILLSFKAGLRACEIAGLEWPMVLGSDKRVAHQIVIARGIAKKGSGRQIPLNAKLRKALQRLHIAEGEPTIGALIRSERGENMSAGSVVNWFGQVYRELGLNGCSSHSGRRTFITASARVLAKTGGSLRDIQELAGHRALTTTERYIEGNRAAQRKLISLL